MREQTESEGTTTEVTPFFALSAAHCPLRAAGEPRATSHGRRVLFYQVICYNDICCGVEEPRSMTDHIYYAAGGGYMHG